MTAYPSSFPSEIHLAQDGTGGAPPAGEPPSSPGHDGSRLGPSSFGLLASVAAECPIAVMLLDASLRVLYANPGAERLVAQGDGLSVAAGILKLGREEADELRLRRAIAGDRDALEALARAFYLLRTSGRRPYEVTLRVPVLPKVETEPGLSSVGLLYVRDPEEGVEISVMALRRQFGLTTSEARTALAVVAGGGVQHTGETLGLRPMTVRGYLRQVFDKTGAHTQADLVRLILCGVSQLPFDGGESSGRRHGSKRPV